MLPLARRRLGVPLPIAAAAAVAAPFGMAVAVPRSRKRDAAVYALQMWAYMVMHELPNDDPRRLERRALVDYPIRFDRAVFGCAPTVVLQRALGRPGRTTALDHALVYAHWAWFVQPHLAAAWILWRHPRRFPRAGDDDLRGLRPRPDRVLRRAHRPALVGGRAGPDPGYAEDHG